MTYSNRANHNNTGLHLTEIITIDIRASSNLCVFFSSIISVNSWLKFTNGRQINMLNDVLLVFM